MIVVCSERKICPHVCSHKERHKEEGSCQTPCANWKKSTCKPYKPKKRFTVKKKGRYLWVDVIHGVR